LMPSLDAVTLSELQNMLHEINPYVYIFKQTGTILHQDRSQHLTMLIKDSRVADSHQYNLPCASEVAAIIVEEPNNETEISSVENQPDLCSEENLLDDESTVD
ncbi:984_t:CDS:2, partial [Racocetra fulgida]